MKTTQRSTASAIGETLKPGHPAAIVHKHASSPLLDAIKNSTTSMDQIVQRRIGADNASPDELK